MKILGLICLVALFVSACNTEKSKRASIAGAEDSSTAVDQLPDSILSFAGCFIMTIEKDTATMNLSQSGISYTGDLEYKRFEKDVNRGKVNLVDSGKYLKGWYAFESEGMISVRELIFKKTVKGLAEGYGDIEVISDTVFYKYPANLRFEERHPFFKEICQ